jgi:pimeloyl-ACP methyl ester carboxylesterase
MKVRSFHPSGLLSGQKTSMVPWQAWLVLILSFFVLFPRMQLLLVSVQAADQERAAGSTPPSATSRLPLKPCQVPDIDEMVLCGQYEVYEDRKRRGGRKIALNIVVLPALSSTPAPDPLFIFGGGPGVAATESASGYAEYFDAKLRDRDIVFVDQRGTGRSNPLGCKLDANETIQTFLAGRFPSERFRDCRRQLEQQADLRFYTTPIAMEDLDEVRRWLGYRRINLLGGSYGTRAAMVYLRGYPNHVRTVTLQGVLSLSNRNPLYSPRDAQRSLDRLLDDCAAEAACAKAFPNLRQDLRTVFARLAKTPAKIKVSDPPAGNGMEVEISREVFVGGLRRSLYNSDSQATVPLMINRALAGDFKPFESVISQALGIEKMLSLGMYLSVTCAEDVSLIQRRDIVRETGGSFLGTTVIDSLVRVCEEWPRGRLPAAYNRPVRSGAPVLIFSGELDPQTPPLWGAEIAQHLPNSLHIVMRGVAHMGFPDCGMEIMTQFISKGSTKGLDTSCVKELVRLPFTIPASE